MMTIKIMIMILPLIKLFSFFKVCLYITMFVFDTLWVGVVRYHTFHMMNLICGQKMVICSVPSCTSTIVVLKLECMQSALVPFGICHTLALDYYFKLEICYL